MKREHLLYVLISAQLIVVCAYANVSKVLVTGSLYFPSSALTLPSFKMLYQGYKYPVEVSHEVQRKINRGHFELYVDAACKELFILVTENLQIPDKNNFDHLKTLAGCSYRLFKLSRYEIARETKDEPSKYSWSVEEVQHDKQEIALPDNTLIFFIPPTMIARLEEDPWLADQHVARLPHIVFNELISDTELQEAAARMALVLLDFELFHTQLPKRLMICDSRIVAMPYVQRSLRS